VKTDADEEKAHILEELFATEKSFVRVLELICKNFYHTLKDLVSPDDCRVLFHSAQVSLKKVEGLMRKDIQQVKVYMCSTRTSFLFSWYYPSCYPFCSCSFLLSPVTLPCALQFVG